VFNAKNEVGGFLRLRGSSDDQLLVVLQLLEPGVKVGGGVYKAGFSDVRLTEVCEASGDDKLGDERFAGAVGCSANIQAPRLLGA